MESRIKQIMAKELYIEEDKIKDDAFMHSLPEMDSLTLTEIIMAIEDEFGIDIPDNSVFFEDMSVQQFINKVKELVE